VDLLFNGRGGKGLGCFRPARLKKEKKGEGVSDKRNSVTDTQMALFEEEKGLKFNYSLFLGGER